MSLYGYIPPLIALVLLALGMFLLFTVLPSLSQSRLKKGPFKPELKISDVIKNLSKEGSPDPNSRYTEPYESGEVARGEYNGLVRVQYYVIVLLFILFDVDMALLIPWAYDFKNLGLFPFIETIVFILMPIFSVYYAFRKGYMRWLR